MQRVFILTVSNDFLLFIISFCVEMNGVAAYYLSFLLSNHLRLKHSLFMNSYRCVIGRSVSIVGAVWSIGRSQMTLLLNTRFIFHFVSMSDT